MAVVLLIVNLLRTPDEIWANRWIAAWAALLIIHAVCLGIVWAIRQWNAEDADEPVDFSDSRWRQTAMFGWGAAGSPPSPEPREVEFRVTQPPEQPPTPTPTTSPWANWNVGPERNEVPDSERASWSEASPAAWLERRSRSSAPEKPDTNPDPDA